MNKLALPHDAFVFVGDGRKALFLRNAGDAKFPNLVTERVFADANPATHDQGSDRPGRSFASAHSTQRSAMEPTDWHEIEEHRFVQRVSAALEALVRRTRHAGAGHRRAAARARRAARRRCTATSRRG